MAGSNVTTTFPNGVGQFGQPQFPPNINPPLGGTTTNGNIWWVDTTNGSDNNNGLYPTTAFATIAKALTACTASGNDTVYVYPGTYTLTASLTLNKANVSLIGIGSGGPGGYSGPNLTASGIGAAMVKVAANSITIRNFTFTGEAARACLDCSVASSFALIDSCEFIVPDSATATAVASTAKWTESVWSNCTFKGLGTITALITTDGNNNRFLDCALLATVSGKTITTGLLTAATSLGLLIQRCTVQERDTAVFTTGIDVSAATYSSIFNCYSNMGTQTNFLTFTGTGNLALGCNVANGTV